MEFFAVYNTADNSLAWSGSGSAGTIEALQLGADMVVVEISAALYAVISAPVVQPPRAPRFTGPEILFLHTIPERAAARRMAIAVYPAGHPLAGQLVDPDGNVQVLLDTLLAFPGTLTLDDTFFLQGNALLLGLGILTPERAARIRAGLPPEVA